MRIDKHIVGAQGDIDEFGVRVGVVETQPMDAAFKGFELEGGASEAPLHVDGRVFFGFDLSHDLAFCAFHNRHVERDLQTRLEVLMEAGYLVRVDHSFEFEVKAGCMHDPSHEYDCAYQIHVFLVLILCDRG